MTPLRALAIAVAVTAATPALALADAPAVATPPAETAAVTAGRAELAAAYRRLAARPSGYQYLRAALEELAALGVGAAWYWHDADRQAQDWADPTLHDRLTLDAWRFDNNTFATNFAWHPLVGGQFHLFARSNDLGLWGSMAFGLATSLAWELGPEYRERVSINDVVATTTAGTPVGEFFHWMGRYLESAPDPRGWHRYARWGLSPTRTAHDLADRRNRLRAGTSADALGFSSDIWHHFELSTGYAHGALGGDAQAADGPDTVDLGSIAAEADLVALPGYLRARDLSRRFADGNVSSARVRLAFGDRAFGADLAADAMLLGYHQQQFAESGAGTATTVGIGLGVRYRHERLGDWTDRLAQMHLPGLAIDQHLRGERVGLRVRARFHPDLAGIHAAAYPRWNRAHPGVTEPSVLGKEGYYFGWGLSGALDADLALPLGVTLGGSIDYGRFASQRGLDSQQEWVTDDAVAGDRAFDWQARLRAAPGGRGYVEATVSEQRRDGFVGEIESSQRLRRVQVVLGAAL